MLDLEPVDRAEVVVTVVVMVVMVVVMVVMVVVMVVVVDGMGTARDVAVRWPSDTSRASSLVGAGGGQADFAGNTSWTASGTWSNSSRSIEPRWW